MKNIRKRLIESMMLLLISTLTCQLAYSQQIEIQGELKVTQMTANDTQDNLVIRNTDGTLGTRSVESLPPPPPPIDTTRNLASDFELAKHLCDCPNLPPFMIKKLLDSGYTQEELVGSGVSVQNVIDAQRGGVLIDSRDNKSYKTVTIGAQTWMAENLNFGTRVDGGTTQTNNSIIEKHCYDNNDTNCTLDGALYQWDEMMQYVTTGGTQGICPTGWHLPTDGEWKTLEIALGMTQAQADAGGYRGTDQGSQLAGLASIWTDGALDQNGAFGSSGFEVFPGGYSSGPTFLYQSTRSYYWTSSENEIASTPHSYFRSIRNDNTQVYLSSLPNYIGMSVRCVLD